MFQEHVAMCLKFKGKSTFFTKNHIKKGILQQGVEKLSLQEVNMMKNLF